MKTEEIKEVLDRHKMWIRSDGKEGTLADLSYTNLSGVDLSRANLSGASLSRASLSGASLSRASLSGASLSRANLHYANLCYADLTRANLRYAELFYANLSGASLSGASLSGADLGDANLSRTNLVDANLSGANLSRASLIDANLSPAPVIENIHQKVFEAASQPYALNMDCWHTCETTHCRAGWVTTLAGKEGAWLEGQIGTSAAAALIYSASDPNLERIPDFHCDDDAALADMKACAEREAGGST